MIYRTEHKRDEKQHRAPNFRIKMQIRLGINRKQPAVVSIRSPKQTKRRNQKKARFSNTAYPCGF